MRNPYLVCGLPLGPREAPLQKSAVGPAPAFAAWWAMHGDAVRLYVINSTNNMRGFSNSLRDLLDAYSRRYHEQQSAHERIYEARLNHWVLREREDFFSMQQRMQQRMDILHVAFLDRAEELEEEFPTEIAVFRQAQNNLRLFTRVLDDLWQVFHRAGQNPDSLDPARIWPTVRSAVRALEAADPLLADYEDSE